MFHFAQVTALALATVFIAAVNSQTSPSCTRQYTVQSGDFCDKISAEQHVSTYQLATLNNAINSDCSNLFVGEVLCLGIEGQDCDQVAVVQEGDSCWAIATAAGISVDTLVDNNPNVATDCSNIYPGGVLCVAPASISN